jgi:glucosamine-phosphate N-acetyltransferase
VLTYHRFNIDANSKWARTFFGNGRGVDFGSGVPHARIAPIIPPTPLPDLDMPIFSEILVSQKIATELPHGHSIRPLCRGDIYRGYMDVMRIAGRIGQVSEDMWSERCEWLRSMNSTYFIVVITGPNLDGTDEKVVATGTLFFEHKFLHGLGVVGHIEDIAVAKDQKGKKMGLRILEALTYAAEQRGCYKVGGVGLLDTSLSITNSRIQTMVNCTDGNEAFHAQAGFSKEGSQMVLHHIRKREE